MIGYDVHKPNVDRLNEVINEQFKDVGDRCQLFHSDGTALEELKDEAEYLDAVVTDPPYVPSRQQRSIAKMTVTYHT